MHVMIEELMHIVDVSKGKVQWAFGSFNWEQLNIHCNRKDLERISMDITANLARSRYYLCLKLQLHCMKHKKGGRQENGHWAIILNWIYFYYPLFIFCSCPPFKKSKYLFLKILIIQKINMGHQPDLQNHFMKVSSNLFVSIIITCFIFNSYLDRSPQCAKGRTMDWQLFSIYKCRMSLKLPFL